MPGFERPWVGQILDLVAGLTYRVHGFFARRGRDVARIGETKDERGGLLPLSLLFCSSRHTAVGF